MQTVRSHSHKGCYQNAEESWKGGRGEPRQQKPVEDWLCLLPCFPWVAPRWPWVWQFWMGGPGYGGSGWVVLDMVALGLVGLGVVTLVGWP